MANKALAGWLACAVLSVWLAVYCFETGGAVVRAYNPLPEMDYWEIVPHLDGYREFPPKVLWEQHYEHRVVFPELIFAADWMWLKGREVLPLLLTALLHLAVWGLLFVVVREAFAGIRLVAWCALCLAGIVMSWPGVAFVLAFPFSLQWLMCQFSAVLSLWMLARGRLGWTIALAVIATFSSANGFCLWPVLMLASWFVKRGGKQLFGLVGVAAVSAAVFSVGYRNLGNSHPEQMFTHTAKFVGYFVAYLGMPFGAAGVVTSLVAGSVSLLLVAGLAFLVWRGGRIAEPIAIVCFGICMLTLLTALLTTASRIPIDRPFLQAVITPPRYVVFAVQYWAALVILLVWVTGQVRVSYAWTAILVVSLFFAGNLSRTGKWVSDWMNQYSVFQYASLAIESGLVSEEMGRHLNYASASLVSESVAELKGRRLALYSWDDYQLLGKQVMEFADRKTIELAPAAVTDIEKIEGGFRIVGWAKPHAGKLVVLDGADRVIGFGRHLPGGEPLGVAVPAGHGEDFWIAFAGPTFNRERSRYLILR